MRVPYYRADQKTIRNNADREWRDAIDRRGVLTADSEMVGQSGSKRRSVQLDSAFVDLHRDCPRDSQRSSSSTVDSAINSSISTDRTSEFRFFAAMMPAARFSDCGQVAASTLWIRCESATYCEMKSASFARILFSRNEIHIRRPELENSA